jgi:dihydrofolate reductase
VAIGRETPCAIRSMLVSDRGTDESGPAASSLEGEHSHQEEHTMSELIVTEFMTLDGIAQAPGGPEEDPEGNFEYGGWQAPLIDAESGGAVFDQAKTMGALLLGRRTYDIFAGYWPTAPAEMDFTRLLNRVPRYVATRTLKEPLSWEGASVLEGDLAEGVAGLKERYGRVHVIGSLHLVRSLLAQGLVDRLNLWVYPVVLGSGKRVFEGGAVPSALRLTRSRVFANGSLQLEYERAGEPTVGDLSDPDGAV